MPSSYCNQQRIERNGAGSGTMIPIDPTTGARFTHRAQRSEFWDHDPVVDPITPETGHKCVKLRITS